MPVHPGGPGLAGAGLPAVPADVRRRGHRLRTYHGVALEEIARLVGHSGGSAVTEKVYRQEIRPVTQSGGVVMDRIFTKRSPVA